MKTRMNPRLLVVAAFAFVAGCAGATSDATMLSGPEGCANYGRSVGLSFSPETVTRGASVSLIVEWETTWQVDEPVIATLQTEWNPSVEVDLVLNEVGDRPSIRYIGSTENPFGAGAPAGTVSLLVTADDSDPDCRPVPTAATSFLLE